MIIYPAIDLKDGNCVRLYKGDMEQATVFSETPVAQAQYFENAGFKWIHIVDLNGAFSGKPVNFEVVEEILDTVSVPIQLGGGIRRMKTIEQWMQAGIERVILGTAAVKDPELVKTACKEFPDAIAVGLDAHDGKVATEGWAETSEQSVIEMAKRFEDVGVEVIIYTDIGRDGTMTGPDIDGTRALAQAVTIPIIASGGMSSPQDLVAVKALEEDGVEGVILGRSLYDGAITPADALAAA